MARLPTVGGDDGNWGTVLNDFLSQGHNAGGSNKGTTNVINVKDYGATGDGSTDDTSAINAAIAAAQAGTKKATVYFPAGTYITSSVFTLYEGMTFAGPVGAGEREFGNRAVIKNTTTDIFQLTTTTQDVSISNLCFQGSSASQSTNWLTSVNLSTGYVLEYSTIKDCGFDYFINIINGRLLGVWLNANYMNNCSDTLLTLAGSDCIVRDNFIDSNLSGSPTAAFLVILNSFSNSIFEANYITCCPSMGLKVAGGNGLVIARNRIDGASPRGSGSDGAGVYIAGATGIVFSGNYLSQNVQNPFSNYDAAFVLFDSYAVTITDNIFDTEPSGRSIYHIGQSSGTTHDISIKGTVYRTANSLLSTTGTVTSLTWDEWQGKYKSGAGARISDSDYPGTPPNGTTCVVYDTNNSGLTYVAQRTNGSWNHYQVAGTGTATGIASAGINSTTVVSGATTTEALIGSYTISGGTCVAGDTYRVVIGGTIDIGTAGGSLTIFLRIGGLTGTQIGGLAWTLLTGATTGKPFWATFEATIQDAASASTPWVSVEHGYASGSAVSGSPTINYTAASRDMTVDADLAVSAKFGTADASHALNVAVMTIDKMR